MTVFSLKTDCMRPPNTVCKATVLTHLWPWNIHPVSWFILLSLAVPSIPFKPEYRAWPCLVWCWQGVWQRTVKLLVAGQSSAESQSTVMDSSRSSCTCHWLSSRLSELGDERGQAGRSEECVHVNVCVCVWGLEVTVEGHWLGCQSYMGCVCVKKRERDRERGEDDDKLTWVAKPCEIQDGGWKTVRFEAL